MVINIYTIIMLFVAFLSLSLGGFIIYASTKALQNSGTIVSAENRSIFERNGYLIFLLACVALSIRMLTWPLFYFMLQSFVSEVPGAMCMFGVTQILPSTVVFLQIIKPVSFFIIGGWLLCYYVDKSTPTSPLARRNLFFLLLVCCIFTADCIGDLYYVLCMKPLMTVSCCATFFDVPLRPSAMIPQAVFGRHFQKVLFVTYYLTNIILTALLFVSASGKWLSLPSLSRKIILCCQSTFGMVNIPIVIYTFIEIIAPRLMQLPYHHCIYCFIGNGMVPDSPIMIGLFVTGIFATGWTGIIRLICMNEETKEIAGRLLVKINNMAAFCLLSSVIMVTIHLILT